MAISNSVSKALFGEQADFETVSGSFTVDFGLIQSFSYTENNNVEKIGAVNSGHTNLLNEDGIYYVTGSLEVYPTKTSLPILLAAFFGTRGTSGDDYTISSDPSATKNFSARAEYTSDRYVEIIGINFTTFSMEVSKGSIISVTMDYVARSINQTAGTITVTAPTEKPFTILDADIDYGTTTGLIMDSFSLSANWNVTEDEGRGIEDVSAGERRMLKRVIRHGLDLSGSFEAETLSDFGLTYADERTNSNIVVSLSRETDNAHTLTISNARTNTNESQAVTDNSKRMLSVDYEALDFSATGDE